MQTNRRRGEPSYVNGDDDANERNETIKHACRVQLQYLYGARSETRARRGTRDDF